MADKKGTGLMLVGAENPADKEADFNKWYQEENLPTLGRTSTPDERKDVISAPVDPLVGRAITAGAE